MGKGEYSEYDTFIGVRVPQIRDVAKQHFESIDFNEISLLINHPIHEVRHCGLIILLNKYQKQDKKAVFNYYLDNINTVNNWDLVDSTAPQIIGDYIVNHPQKLALLFNFSASKDLWERRIAIVATWVFIKQGKFDTTFEISKLLLNDKHDLIHKAVGWMLREVYKKDKEVCKQFLRENYAQLPRTTLRYAIERMEEAERLRYLKKGLYV
ncbi:probable DNA alkylation repair enzyme [uncultured Candidatus Thioglobus sp.]|nr:probable DNA alkylation repair enzyme [uncultured Candidatus Thioglobus sp.]